jgi:protein TonB
MLMIVIGLHIALALAFFYLAPVRSKPPQVRPVQMSIIAAPAPPKPAPIKPLPVLPQVSPMQYKPQVPTVVMALDVPPMPSESRLVAAVQAHVEQPARAAAPSAAPIVTVVPESAPSASPKQLPPSAVRYLREPSLTVPLQSRRLGESGVVHLRIVVDAQGQLKEVSLKKSAGFTRLDQQALHDIRTARFAPYLENGRAIEWETTALLSYESEK